jgi:hypothetical protein
MFDVMKIFDTLAHGDIDKVKITFEKNGYKNATIVATNQSGWCDLLGVLGYEGFKYLDDVWQEVAEGDEGEVVFDVVNRKIWLDACEEVEVVVTEIQEFSREWDVNNYGLNAIGGKLY